MQNVVNAGFGAEYQTFDHDRPGPGNQDVRRGPVDFVFLAAQTFDDRELQRDVLGLFVTQVRRVVPALRSMAPREQTAAAHLLVGSARGIGAREAALAAECYGAADPAARDAMTGRLADAFRDAVGVIEAHLAAAGP